MSDEKITWNVKRVITITQRAKVIAGSQLEASQIFGLDGRSASSHERANFEKADFRDEIHVEAEIPFG